jgi:hypothetical protein
MALLEDVTLSDSIEIKTTPEKIFGFLFNLVDDESYRAWHPESHVALRWIKGQPWRENSIVYAEEIIHGKLHKVKFVVTKMVMGELIEYAPVSRLLRIYFPGNKFIVLKKGDVCEFTASVTYRIGKLARKFAKNHMETGLASVRQHMKEEGENLKKILEG